MIETNTDVSLHRKRLLKNALRKALHFFASQMVIRKRIKFVDATLVGAHKACRVCALVSTFAKPARLRIFQSLVLALVLIFQSRLVSLIQTSIQFGQLLIAADYFFDTRARLVAIKTSGMRLSPRKHAHNSKAFEVVHRAYFISHLAMIVEGRITSST